MTKEVNIIIDGPVTIIEINRPNKRNAVDRNTAELLVQAFKSFENNKESKCAVLCGSNGSFCAGADLAALDNRMEENGDGPMGISRMVLSKPLICAISGYAVAGGLELALLGDIRICEENSIFGVFCRRFGVPLIDGGTIRLPRIIGRGNALYMTLTGFPVNSTDALRMGLVSEIVPVGKVRDRAIELAKSISDMPEKCMLSDRQSLYEQENLSMKDALINEFKLGKQVVLSNDFTKGPQSFVEGKGRHGSFKSKL